MTAPLRLELLEDRTTPAATAAVDPSAFAPDRALVTLAAGADATTAVAKLADLPFAAGVERLGFNIYQVNLPAGVPLAVALPALDAVRGVAVAEVDYAVRVTATPDDPGYGNLWGLNSGNDADIDAAEAWDAGRGTGGKIVAVIDSGVDYTHPDLAANLWRNPGETAGDGVDNDGNGVVDDVFGADFVNNDGDPMDDHGHGSHVAGTIGAVGNNGVGVTGVAWATRLMALKFLNASGTGSTSNAIRCIDYAVAKGSSVLNASWGGGGFSFGLDEAIRRAEAAGVIFVAAAGNSGSNNDTAPYYPANYSVGNVLSVAATDGNDNLASFSNYGATTVDLGAPGVSVYSTLPGGGYGWKSGTSMAAPHVAGAVAVYWDQNPALTHSQVIARLLAAVDPKASLAGKTATGGRLNLKRLMDTSPPAPPPPLPWEPPHAVPHREKFGRSGLSVPVNNLSTAHVDVKVPSRPFAVDLNVVVFVDHTHTGDLIVTLTAPDGRAVTLFNRRGGSGDNLKGTRFDDEAATPVAAGQAPFAGSFRPEQPLAAFDGRDPGGVWRLSVQDKANGDVGVIKGVVLDFALAGK